MSSIVTQVSKWRIDDHSVVGFLLEQRATDGDGLEWKPKRTSHGNISNLNPSIFRDGRTERRTPPLPLWIFLFLRLVSLLN